MFVCRHPASQEGRYGQSSRNVERGMRWTRLGCRTSSTEADGESVWSWPPDAEVKLCETFREATEAIKPGPPGERAISRKPLAQGMPDVSAYLW
jgi:hypothetical protein